MVVAMALVTLAMLLSSCTVPTDGFAGVKLDEHGNALGVLRTCKHPLDGATLWSDESRGSDNPHAVVVGRWEFSDSTVTQALTWPLGATSAAGVTAERPPEAMPPERTFTLRGWTTDSSWSVVYVRFTLSDLEHLSVGKILVREPGTEPRVVSEPEFDALICD
ncbi:hypothetical protein [Micromonospora sp. ATA51]|uniref:Uncharacterized protein n=2 Tax=Micromonospora sicca TaxID=2202420 RepID=A0A317DH74_9ACTN|nr:hypothetical protein [Micromonospora sp. ATA51]MBM0229947.1 hypothetical protein [Micromonospora sp. ATA51]PWR13814.1 hypothetical protein DKT69_19105 [Micromonospora sp. 4G51]